MCSSDLAAERKKAAELAKDYRALRERLAEQDREFKKTVQARLREAVRQAEDELSGIVESQKKQVSDTRRGREELSKVREKLEVAWSETGSGAALDWSKAKKGERVAVLPLGIEAELLENPPADPKDDTQIKVRMGKLTVRVEAKKIRALPPKVEEKKDPLEKAKKKGALELARTTTKKQDKLLDPRQAHRPVYESASMPGGPILPPTAGNTLDLRGERVYEAENAVERFLDESCREHLPNVFIIHGHGTGALKQLVREILAGSPYVESFRPGERGEGGDGVTMVVLKEWGY